MVPCEKTHVSAGNKNSGKNALTTKTNRTDNLDDNLNFDLKYLKICQVATHSGIINQSARTEDKSVKNLNLPNVDHYELVVMCYDPSSSL